MNKRPPARAVLLPGIAALRRPNQKRGDLFNPFSIALLQVRTSHRPIQAAHECFASFSAPPSPRIYRLYSKTLEDCKSSETTLFWFIKLFSLTHRGSRCISIGHLGLME